MNKLCTILFLAIFIIGCNDKTEVSSSHISKSNNSVATINKSDSGIKRKVSSYNETLAQPGDYNVTCFGRDLKKDYYSEPSMLVANRILGEDAIKTHRGFKEQKEIVVIEKPYEIISAYSNSNSAHCMLIKKL
ncbi:MAG: hypothetical protein ACJAT2_000412 [Bacteriovoracaceae bacterium]|jgi:hypothetical protein